MQPSDRHTTTGATAPGFRASNPAVVWLFDSRATLGERERWNVETSKGCLRDIDRATATVNPDSCKAVPAPVT